MATLEDPELHRVLKAHVVRHVAPEDLRVAVARLGTQVPRSADAGASGWLLRLRAWFAMPGLRLSTSFAAGVCATLIAVALHPQLPREDGVVVALLSDHARALTSSSTIEVISESTHTVKPWLSSKLGYSPAVVDLRERGFPLLGGRRGFVGSEPVAVMVYTYHEHEIDLYALRGTMAQDVDATPVAHEGYNVRVWQQGDLRYVAISDVAAARIDEFAAAAHERQLHPAD